MAKPWFKFYVDDFIGATWRWTTLEVGAYMRLLMEQYQHGYIPKDHAELADMLGLTGAEFRMIWRRVGSKFVPEGAGLINRRMAKLRDEQQRSYQRRVKAAEKSHQSRRCNANAMQLQIQSNLELSKNQTLDDQESKSKTAGKTTQKNCNANAMHLQDLSGSGSGSGSGSRSGSGSGYSDEFLEFWSVYPSGRKTGKKAAYKAFCVAIKSATAKTIIAAAGEYGLSAVGQGQYVKTPTAWLNQGCWDDDRSAWSGFDNDTKNNRQATREQSNAEAGLNWLGDER